MHLCCVVDLEVLLNFLLFIFSEFRGCESNLQEVLYVEPDICKSNGDEDDCYEGVVENPGPDPVWTDMEWRICCCKGNL